MSVLDPESRDLFRMARSEVSPPDASRDRVRARLAAKLGAAAMGAAIGATTTTAGGGASAGAGTTLGAGSILTKTSTLALIGKIALPLVIVGAATTIAAPRVGKLLAPTQTSASSMPVARLAPAAKVVATQTTEPTSIADKADKTDVEVPIPTVVSVIPTLPVPALAPVQSSAARPVSPRAVARDPSEESLAKELALVDQIERSLRTGDSEGAARLTTEHEKRFPHGALVEEREGARVLSHCLSGASAIGDAEAFLTAHPKSPMRARILAACTESKKEK